MVRFSVGLDNDIERSFELIRESFELTQKKFAGKAKATKTSTKKPAKKTGKK
ncbi:MAG: hypothetical protein K2I87_01095 [Bacteroidales bacterium]|nr:hypothetical protein [Bacteroidales bacterium]